MEPNAKKLKLLIVDDHAVLRESIRIVLDGLPDIEVAGEAGTGAAAIETCRSNAFDVVLLDIRLPDQPGPEVARILKRECGDPKIIIFSMRSEETGRLLMENADAFVSKSAGGDAVIETIRSCFRRENG